MLPLQLLRVKIINKGKNISPVFCRPDDNSFYELKLAEDMINEFEESHRKKEKKRKIAERIALLESTHDDYRLVRGLYALLERRCTFGNGESTSSRMDNAENGRISDIDSFYIRRKLFEESSRQGYALTELKRQEIINSVASKISMSYDEVEREMWADLDENLVLVDFASIEPQKLIAWYNLSLMQTLLFNSTKLEFSVNGGYNWKRALRAVKKLGLMYNLQYQHRKNLQGEQKMTSTEIRGQDIHPASNRTTTSSSPGSYYDDILCTIDGPLSIFKLTDRYGTSIAKLLPSVTEADEWSIKAIIVRKTASNGKKIYEFSISSKESPDLPKLTDLFIHNNYSNIRNTIYEKPVSSYSSAQATFDSSVEQKFAMKFEQVCSDWRLIREPDPLIVSDGRGFIPDFAFEKYGIRVYLEIVGFWTNGYLVRKIQKIADVISLSSSKEVPTPVAAHQGIQTRDFFIAVNIDSYVSDSSMHNEKMLASLRLSDYISQDHLIKYKNDNVPVKPILDHLRTIDLEVVGRLAKDNRARLEEELNSITDNNRSNGAKLDGIISLDKIAERCGVPIESVSQVIRESEDLKTGGFNDHYFVDDRYLIPVTIIKEMKQLLKNNSRYMDACKVLAEHNVPEVCYGFVLQKAGYEIVWHNMDISGATIKSQDS